jgi:glyoxylase I family protein
MRFHHVAIICSNYQVSKEFYTQVLGFSVVSERYRKDRDSYKLNLAIRNGAAARAGQGEIELFSFPTPPPRPSYPEATGLRHLAFAVDDLDAAVADLQAKGLSFQPIRLDPITDKRFTFFSDPDGLPLELYEEKR